MAAAIEQTIEGKNLEQNQRKAVLTNGKNICVNAGAGSGKTFTILAKVLHLLDLFTLLDVKKENKKSKA